MKNRPERLKVRAATTITRRCMTCRAEFESTGNHNRMCDACRVCSRNTSPYEPAYEWGERLLGNQTLAHIKEEAGHVGS